MWASFAEDVTQHRPRSQGSDLKLLPKLPDFGRPMRALSENVMRREDWKNEPFVAMP